MALFSELLKRSRLIATELEKTIPNYYQFKKVLDLSYHELLSYECANFQPLVSSNRTHDAVLTDVLVGRLRR